MHNDKSIVVTTQQIVFVGFLLCSVHMTVRVPPEECTDMIELCREILATKQISIRKFAQLIGQCVFLEPGVRYAPLYYKLMETERDQALNALKLFKSNFDAIICLSDESKMCIEWWIYNIETSFRPNRRIESDSSGTVEGATMFHIM